MKETNVASLQCTYLLQLDTFSLLFNGYTQIFYFTK